MKTLHIQGRDGDSQILVGESIRNFRKFTEGKTPIVITDANVIRHYGELFSGCPVIQIGTGENSKTLDTLGQIYERLIELEADRSSCIVGIGGGIVCDVTGFAASTYLRGVRFGFAATTLLAQVDASVGGKNGVNFLRYKNMVGVFNQPEFVVCDPETLKTLPEKEIVNGLAEVVKHAAIADASMMEYLESHAERALQLDPSVIERLVHDSVRIKSDVVNRDERERGERRKLNFGHTFGHAIENTAQISHGEAVSIGMVVAARLSARRGYLNESDVLRLENLLIRLKLPVTIRADRKKALDALRKDKKRVGDKIHFVLLQEIGKAVVEEITLQELEEVIHDT